uniref:Polycomb protein EED n=1 Tax=Rhizochromulina marina TaxID=1034831 RepID=A0A7S2SUZ6_9STRA|mmetsp:Transcript_8884/g.25357  ORF Transcript_8884/g.25357 Transcript_8884/m.25357 type:complete len:525 (+) Transcript_8884:194-1768(+)
MGPAKKRRGNTGAAAAAAADTREDGDGAEGRGGRISLRFGGFIHEDHKQPIYCVSFFDPLPGDEVTVRSSRSDQYFAAVGANRATVYQIAKDGALSVAQAFVDEDVQETFYTCAWTISVALTPILSVAGLRGLIKVVDCVSGRLLTTLVGHGNAVNELKTHPVSPSLLFSASKDESIRLWNMHTNCCIAIFAGDQGHRDEVLSMDVHLLGNCFASCGMDNTVKIWALDKPRVQENIRRSHESTLPGTAQDAPPTNSEPENPGRGGPVANGVIGVGGDGAAGSTRVSGAANGDNRASLETAATPVANATTPMASVAKENSNGGSTLNEALRPQRFRTIFEQFPIFSSAKIHSDYVDCVRWVGNMLLSKSTASKIVLWKPDVYRINGQSSLHIDDEESPAASSSSGQHAQQPRTPALSDSDAVKIAMNGAEKNSEAVAVLREFAFRDAEIWFVRFSLDPLLQRIAVGNKLGKLWIWDVDGFPIQPLVKNMGHVKCNSAIRQTCFSPDGKFLVSCCDDGSIWKWSLD